MEMSGSKLQEIRPPRLEDAGLEDCALPPEGIKEAFLKAATSVKSRAAAIFSTDEEKVAGGCIEDPAPVNGELKDSLVGGSPDRRGTALPEVLGDKVVPGVGDGESFDEVRVVGASEVGGAKACVEGVGGLDTGVKSGKSGYESEDEDEEEEKPILAEACI